MQNFSGGSPNFRPGKSRRIKKLIQKKRKIRLHVAFLSQKTSRVQRIYIDSWRYISHCAFLTWLLTHWSITEKISNGFLLPPKRNPIETKWLPKKRSNIINLCRFISSWTRFLVLVHYICVKHLYMDINILVRLKYENYYWRIFLCGRKAVTHRNPQAPCPA